jgi:anti-sigma factor RsiW
MPTAHLTDEQLSAQLDRALSDRESAAVDSHLDDCAECATRRDLLRATSQAVASLPGEEMPRPLDLGFLRPAEPTAAAAPRGFAARVIHGRPPVWLPTAVAAAAVLVLAITVAPRFLPHVGGASLTAGGPGGAAPAAPEAARGSSQGHQPSGAAPGDALSDQKSNPGFLAPLVAGQNAVTGPDGSTVTIQAYPPHSSTGQPTQVVLKLVGGPSGTALAPQGMELFVSMGSSQVRLAAAIGSAGPRLKTAEELDLSGEWSAGALAGPPAAGTYTLIGRVFLADRRMVEVALPFIVSRS